MHHVRFEWDVRACFALVLIVCACAGPYAYCLCQRKERLEQAKKEMDKQELAIHNGFKPNIARLNVRNNKVCIRSVHAWMDSKMGGLITG